MSIANAPSQTVPGFREKVWYRQIAELHPSIAINAMEDGVPLAGRPVFTMHDRSAKEALKADKEGSAVLE
jgi:hypothetical protein